MWHHATYRGDELIVLGHDPRRNDCLLVKLSGLPMNEQSEIRKIAASRSAQRSNYLIPILRRVESPFGNDWFSYLCKKMEQRNAPVFTLPIKEIQDSLDPDQKAIFKGYGKGRKNQSLEVDNLGREYGQFSDEADAEGQFDDDSELEQHRPIQQVQRQTVAPPVNNLDYKLDLLIETVSGENRQTQELLNKLLTVLAGKAAAPAKAAQDASRPPRSRKARSKSDTRIRMQPETQTELEV